MTTINDTDLFVVQSGKNGEVCNYSGVQFKDDINLILAERDVKVWVQDSPPPTPNPPDYASQKDLWFDTSIGAFFVGALDDGGGDSSQVGIIWIIVNPADRRKFMDVSSGEVIFPQGTTDDQVFVHPNTGVTYHFKVATSQWMDKDLPGLDTFVLREGDTMTGALQLPNLIVTGDDTVGAHIELNGGLLTADDSVAGEEQRLYWNGDTVAKHEDVVTLTNIAINNDQHVENITPYTFRGLQQFGTTEAAGGYVLYDSTDTATDVISSTEKVFVSNSDLTTPPKTFDASLVTHGMYLEVQAIEGTNKLIGKVTEKTSATDGTIFTLSDIKSNGVSVDGEVSHVRIFSVADSSAKGGVFYQPDAPTGPDEHLNVGQLWVDSSTNIQYIWTGKEWSEVGAACGGGSSTAIPVATIWPYAGNINSDTPLPTGWLLCDGSAIDARYVRLIKLIGGNVPDLRGRYLGGAGQFGIGSVRSTHDDYTRRPRNNNFVVSSSSSNTGAHKHPIDDHTQHRHNVGNIKATARRQKQAGSKNGGNAAEYTDANSGRSDFSDASLNMSGSTELDNDNNSNANSHWRRHVCGNAGNHNHTITTTVENWDSYTRPYTYGVYWIIKHD